MDIRLKAAMDSGDVDTALALIHSDGCDVRAIEQDTGESVFHKVAKLKNCERAEELLIDYFSSSSVKKDHFQDNNSCTPWII